MNAAGQQQPTIIVLKEGTDSSQGKPQLLSNITSCQVEEHIRRWDVEESFFGLRWF